MAQQVHGRTAGAPLQGRQQPQQPGGPAGEQQPQQPGGPAGEQAAGQGEMPDVPVSVLLGVAVQAALYWSPDDPDRPAWSMEAQRALQGLFSGMPTRV